MFPYMVRAWFSVAWSTSGPCAISSSILCEQLLNEDQWCSFSLSFSFFLHLCLVMVLCGLCYLLVWSFVCVHWSWLCASYSCRGQVCAYCFFIPSMLHNKLIKYTLIQKICTCMYIVFVYHLQTSGDHLYFHLLVWNVFKKKLVWNV